MASCGACAVPSAAGYALRGATSRGSSARSPFPERPAARSPHPCLSVARSSSACRPARMVWSFSSPGALEPLHSHEATTTLAQGGPLLLHASSAALVPTHRRVIHIEFAADDLPAPLQWSTRV